MDVSFIDITAIWNKYKLPEYKRNHCLWVAKVANFLAEKIMASKKNIKINTKDLITAALLHDIDKNIPKLSGENHPDAAVRILKQEGFGAGIVSLVASHPLQMIISSTMDKLTWEQKILYLSDKMVKHEVITVDERFKLWNQENNSNKVN